MSSPSEIPVVVLGATGYTGGELLRLLAGHPRLQLRAAVSRSRAGQPVTDTFPHLRGTWDGLCFAAAGAVDSLIESSPTLAVFACLPHGETAARVDALLTRAEARGVRVHLVDLSADFRLPTAEDFAAVYDAPHPAPQRYGDFTCGLPELTSETPSGAVANPGCFTTAVTLACAPAQALGLAEPRYRVSAITGSTGSGRTPKVATHHPERHANLKAYSPLGHRHAPEMEMLLARLGGSVPQVDFVPHSGPWSRGIHATVHLDLARKMTTDELAEHYTAFYSATPFVCVGSGPPRLKDVVGTNRCHIGVATEGQRGVVFSVIDNLTKGASGGALHWMNRLCGFDEALGLDVPGVGWL